MQLTLLAREGLTQGVGLHFRKPLLVAAFGLQVLQALLDLGDGSRLSLCGLPMAFR